MQIYSNVFLIIIYILLKYHILQYSFSHLQHIVKAISTQSIFSTFIAPNTTSYSGMTIPDLQQQQKKAIPAQLPIQLFIIIL